LYDWIDPCMQGWIKKISAGENGDTLPGKKSPG
jgi:hypothetical protein